MMPSVLHHLAEHHAGLRVGLLETNGNHREVERALSGGHADLAFVQLPFSDGFLQWEVLRDPYVALRIKGSGKKEHVTWQDLAATPLLLYGDHESTAVIEQYLKGELGQVEPKHQATEDKHPHSYGGGGVRDYRHAAARG